MPLKKPWKTPKEMIHLAIKGKPVHETEWYDNYFAQGDNGRIQIARMRLEGSRSTRVAVKRFKYINLTPTKIEKLRRIIKLFRDNDLPVLKTDYVQLETGEWVQIQELFGSYGNKKFKGDMDTNFTKERVFQEMDILIKMANLGIAADDSLFFRTRDRVYLGDFDYYTYFFRDNPLEYIKRYFRNNYNGNYYRYLTARINQLGTEEVKTAWKKLLASKS